jgi:hypothetical protein
VISILTGLVLASIFLAGYVFGWRDGEWQGYRMGQIDLWMESIKRRLGFKEIKE